MRYLLLLFLVSCSTLKPIGGSVDPYVKTFENGCNCKVKVPIYFADLPDDIIGACYYFKSVEFLRYIEIDTNYWLTADEYSRELTVLHELGRCVLNLEHDTEEYPVGIMHKYLFYSYKYNREEYIKALFKHKGNSEVIMGGSPPPSFIGEVMSLRDMKVGETTTVLAFNKMGGTIMWIDESKEQGVIKSGSKEFYFDASNTPLFHKLKRKSKVLFKPDQINGLTIAIDIEFDPTYQ